MRNRFLAALGVLTTLAFQTSPVQAALDPVFFYDASGLTAGIDVASTIEDQSTANHDARVRFNTVGISTDVPAGLSGKSFDLTGTGMFDTYDDLLISNANVAAAGGYVMEAWVKADATSGGTAKIIDYAGTERISLAGSTTNPAGNPIGNKNHIEMRASNTTYRVGGRLPVELDGNWHYVLSEFVVTDATNLADLKGVMRLTIDGQADVLANGGKSNFGDNLPPNGATFESAQKLAVGTRTTVSVTNPGGSGDNLEGLVYQPKVWLGTVADPVRLRVNTVTGAVSFGYVQDTTIAGATRFGTRINSYDITSAGGSLRPQNLNSFQDQNLDPNPGTGEDGRFDGDDDADGHDFLLWQQQAVTDVGAPAHTGPNATADAKINGVDLAIWSSKFASPPNWQELTTTTSSISELHGTHGSVVGNPTPLALGAVFDPTKPQDLIFKYTVDGDPVLYTGIVQYVTSATTIPEPASAALLLAALAAGGMSRRKIAGRDRS